MICSVLLLTVAALLPLCCRGDYFTDSWAVHIEGGPEEARRVADKHGFVFMTEIIHDHYLFKHRKVSKRSLSQNDHYHQKLSQDTDVLWVEQQVAKTRVKRDFQSDAFNDPEWPKQWYLVVSGYERLFHWQHLPPYMTSAVRNRGLQEQILPSAVNVPNPLIALDDNITFTTDIPTVLHTKQIIWDENRGKDQDMNLLEAYRGSGMTGKGVVVSILDDGIEKDHPDLMKNYDPYASFDVNGNDPDPQPRYDFSNENRHGTRCAGEVAAQANNKICGVGVAHEAGIGGVRMLDGDVTDAVEAQALSLNPQHIDIYSASWGPDDDGRTVDGPGPLARKAFSNGIKAGRRGLGSVFVWASGNGGRDGDNCNCDGYTNSIFTLSISSATENGMVPWYSEGCSSTLATTFSSGGMGERQIITTDLHKLCTESHTGTSASAPLAAGIVALALQANPLLNWRDLQHIVVQTSRQANLKADDWTTNGAGKKVSHHYGFGLLDASAMVDQAMGWTTVPEQHKCEVNAGIVTQPIPVNGRLEFKISTDGCSGTNSAVNFLEHVEAVITLSTSVRGEIELFLTSPRGTRSNLLSRRIRDVSADGFNEWPFMTTHSWGEPPQGVWKLEATNGASVANLKNWTLVMYGTAVNPLSPPSGPRRLLQPGEEACKDGEYLLQPYCYTKCPRAYFESTDSALVTSNVTHIKELTNVSACMHCYNTCLRCVGPEKNQCSMCNSNMQLTKDGECLLIAPSEPQYRNGFNFVIITLAIVISSLIIVIFIVCLIWNYARNRPRPEKDLEKPLLPEDNRNNNAEDEDSS